MKVLLANSSFGGGGITTYAHELINCLTEDYELTVLLNDDSKYPINNPKANILHYDCDLLTVENARIFIHLINEEIKPDILICSNALIISVIAPFLLDSIKVFAISHSGKLFRSDYAAINHKYIDGIIAASSDYNKAYLHHRFKVPMDKMDVIYNFVQDYDGIEHLIEEKSKSKDFIIIYPCGGAAGKGPDIILKLAHELVKTDYQFKFYWTGNTEMPFKTLLKFFKKKAFKEYMPKDDRFVFPGRFPHKDDIDKLMAKSDVLLFPSRNEGCSMTLLEALRAGSIPFVTEYKHSNREIVRDGENGFVINHDDIDRFVRELCALMNDRKRKATMGQNARTSYLKDFTYEVWSKKVAKVLKKKTEHTERKKRISDFQLKKNILWVKWLWNYDLVLRFFILYWPVLRTMIFWKKKL